MIPTSVMSSSTVNKCTFLLVILCALNLYVVNCEYASKSLNNNNLMTNSEDFGISSNENEALSENPDSNELENNGLHNLDYITKLRLLEIFLNEIRRKELLLSNLNNNNNNNVKRSSFMRAMKDDRKRPGWELAYGKRKRSVD